MVKRAKRKPAERIQMTVKEYQAERNRLAKEMTEKVALIYLAALAEKGWSEDELIAMLETGERYAKYIDDHLVKIRDVQEIIERRTGMKMIGW